MENPSIGRIVIYRTPDGEQSFPAMVAGAGELGVREETPLSSPTHAHLFVFDVGFERPLPLLDVPLDEDFGPIAGADESQAPGTWRWPVRV